MKKLVCTHADYNSDGDIDGYTLVVYAEDAGDDADPETEVSVYAPNTSTYQVASLYDGTELSLADDEVAKILEMLADARQVSEKYSHQIQDQASIQLALLLEVAYTAQRSSQIAELQEQSDARKATEEAIIAKYNLH